MFLSFFYLNCVCGFVVVVVVAVVLLCLSLIWGFQTLRFLNTGLEASEY